MTVPHFLALESNDNQVNDARLLLYKDGVVVPLGNSLPTPIGGGNARDAKSEFSDDRARITFFKGDIYVAVDSTVVNRGGIFRTSNYGQSWIQVLDFTDAGISISPNSLHLHTINIRGTETLCMVAWNGDARVAKSTDGVSWDAITWDAGSTSARLGNDLVVGSKLWLLPQDATNATFGGQQYFTFEFDAPEVVDFTKDSGLNDSDCCSAWCLFNGDVYLARPDTRGSSTTVNIYRLHPTGVQIGDGGLDEIVATITHTAGDVTNNVTKWDMFTDGTNMYLFHFHNNTSSGDAWLCHQIDSSFVVTELTSTVLPDYMTALPDTSTNTGTTAGIVRVLTDQVTEPTSPQYFIYVNVNPYVQNSNTIGIPGNSCPWRIYQWQGNSTEMAYVDQGGGVMHAINFGQTKTSDQGPWFAERFANIISPNVSITDYDVLPSGQIRIFYTIRYTGSQPVNLFNAQTVRVIGLYSNLTTDDIAVSQATLTNTSNGTLAANAVSGVPINSGTFFIDWDRATDGITEDTNYTFRLSVSNDG